MGSIPTMSVDLFSVLSRVVVWSPTELVVPGCPPVTLSANRFCSVFYVVCVVKNVSPVQAVCGSAWDVIVPLDSKAYKKIYRNK